MCQLECILDMGRGETDSEGLAGSMMTACFVLSSVTRYA